MKTVIMMLTESLKASGHTGLYDGFGCGCSLNDLALCGAFGTACTAGYAHHAASGDFWVSNVAEPMTDDEIRWKVEACN